MVIIRMLDEYKMLTQEPTQHQTLCALTKQAHTFEMAKPLIKL